VILFEIAAIIIPVSRISSITTQLPRSKGVSMKSDTDSTMIREMRAVGVFSREMLISFALALFFIVYVVQAFHIPSGSMEDSLFAGDMLLGLKFSYVCSQE
jgi:hypothetical protein